jgi:hypothetical protein
MATWGSQTWGFANWGTLGDQTVELSGVQSNSTLGSAGAQSVPGWGAQYWGAGEWGDLKSPEVAVTGQELTSTTQTVTAFTDVTVEPTGQQLGPIIIGDYVEGISVEVDPLGQELNSTVNSVFAGELVTVPVTSASDEAWGENAWSDGGWGVGDGQTIAIGDTSVAIGQQIDAQGQELTATITDVLAGISIVVEPTGVELTPDLGSLSFESKYLIGSAQADTEIGNVSGLANANVDVTGTQITGATGQLEYEVIYSFDGTQATVTAGDAFGGEVVEVQVTTASAQPWGEIAWGDGQWGQSVGTDIGIGGEEVAVPSVEVDVTGIELSSNTGNESVTGDSNLSLTGIALDIQQGDEDAFTNVRINVTGNDVGTIIIGDYLAGISAEVDVSGVTATTSTGIIGLNAWELVDPGTAPTWTVVDKAA